MNTIASNIDMSTAQETSMEEMQAKFDAQRAAFLKNPFLSLETRLDRIDRVMNMLVNNEKAITEAVIADYGRRAYELTRFQEVVSPLLNFKYVRKNLPKWMKAEKRKSSFPYNLIGGKSSVQHVPLGVVGNMSPWNFPFTLTMSPLAGIIAAGNNCMMKPSEYTPHASQLMADLVAKSFNPEELTVVQGGGAVAAEFSKLPFNHMMFTGSTGIAAKILEAAAPNLVPATLELGGKCPVVITDDVNIDQIATKLTAGKLVNAGQICMAPDYVLVPEKHYDALIAGLRRETNAMYPNGHTNPDFAHVISPRHCQRLKDLVENAVAAGNNAIPLFGEMTDAERNNADPRYMQPFVLEMTNLDCDIMQEEIFGPVLPIVKVKSMDEALARISERENPLVAYCFTNDKDDMQRISQGVPCGGVVFNEFYLHYIQQELPFGGVGNSGMGYYNGHEGFKNFSHAKAVFKSPKMDSGKILRPPFDDGKLKSTIDKEMKV